VVDDRIVRGSVVVLQFVVWRGGIVAAQSRRQVWVGFVPWSVQPAGYEGVDGLWCLGFRARL
jgi:hypothetical protein